MSKAYDFDTGKLQCSYRDNVYFDLVIRKNVTQIIGNSATGKSFLVDIIKSGKEFDKVYSDDKFSNIEIFDKEFGVEDLKRISGCLIIIDRGDLILTDEIADYIRMYDRQNNYLVFARCGYAFGISPNYYGKFIISDDNIISIYYKYSARGWF